mgnify:CR=1 FL=1
MMVRRPSVLWGKIMNKTAICKRRLVYCGILAGMFLLLCIAIRSDIYAAEKRLVKVAFFPMEGYHTVEVDGTYSGMDVAYLDALCQYVNWQVEYVACDSWEDALEKAAKKYDKNTLPDNMLIEEEVPVEQTPLIW